MNLAICTNYRCISDRQYRTNLSVKDKRAGHSPTSIWYNIVPHFIIAYMYYNTYILYCGISCKEYNI